MPTQNNTSQNIIVIPEGKICDYIDGTFRNDTPEEYVRQTIEKRLVNEHKYQRDHIKVEYGLKVGSNKPRADIVVFPKSISAFSQDNIWLVVECKNEKVEPTNKKDGIEQLKSYMSVCPNCEWGMWTNGKYKEVLRKVRVGDRFEFQDFNDIPPADGSLDDIDRPKRNKLKKAYEDNLLMVFRTCHNHIYVTDGLQKQQAFFELLKLIFCKTLDEHNIPNPLEFFTTSAERSNGDGQLTVKKRVSKIFERVKKQYNQIFDSNDEIKLQPRSLAYIVSEIQTYSLLDTDIDVKGKAYEELVGANLRGDRGEFFTPRNVMKMAVNMVAPKPHEKVCDPACGTGGFLVTAMNNVIEELEKGIESDFEKPKFAWGDNEKQIVRRRIKEIAESNFFGFDINPDLVKATKMNMVMNNDGSGNIYRNDSLLPPHEWQNELKLSLAKALKIEPSDIANQNTIEFFDVIVTNPPFGSKIPIKDHQILEQYNIGYIWKNQQVKINPKSEWTITNRFQSSAPPEQLFIERCLQLLKPGGRLAIVLPDSILGSPGLGYIRQWLLRKTRIIASIDLHSDTFQPRNGTQTSILILQKKTSEEIDKEEKTRTMPDYNIFMAIIDRIGHDQRGNPLFKRDKYGNEILIPDDDVQIIELDKTADGQPTARVATKKKIRDDQTVNVPDVFKAWKSQEGIAW
ncbi:MAG: N-6 DNA methylase [Ignavibacteriae bacterium]|nr:N-6 DNA methylase [Ignavibacteriota bacterium]